MSWKSQTVKAIKIIAQALAVFIIFAALKLVLWDIPSLSFRNPAQTAFLAIQNQDAKITHWTPLKELPKHLANMVIAAEDARYFEHEGVDWQELDRAVKDYRLNGKKRGASTITMQLARNLYLSPNKHLFRKGLEILIALEMDLLLSKERILEIYLNVVEFGRGIYGAEHAAQHYFKIPAARISREQAAFLVAILPNPKGWGHWPPSGYIRQRMSLIQRRSGHHVSVRSAPTPAAHEKTVRELKVAQPAQEIIDDQDMPAEIFFETE